MPSILQRNFQGIRWVRKDITSRKIDSQPANSARMVYSTLRRAFMALALWTDREACLSSTWEGRDVGEPTLDDRLYSLDDSVNMDEEV